MGFWVVENATGIVKDYSADGSITYDPRFHTTRQDVDLPLGDQPQQYRWNGTNIVKLPPIQAVLDRTDLLAKIDILIADVTIPLKVRDFVAALKKVVR